VRWDDFVTTRALLFGAATIVVAAAAVGCLGGSQKATPASGDQVLRVYLADPETLEPGDAGYDSNVLMNIMDPLVRLGPNFQPRPGLAESWDLSRDKKTITFHLRHDGRWTNGDPVTARDFAWSWLRTLSPRLAKYWAYELYGIRGAQAYNLCDAQKQDCDARRARVGIKAVDDYTLEVQLTSPQPWFPQLAGFRAFLALHRPTVEKYGEAWDDPKHIVTDGPFKLVRWVPDKELDLDRWDGWRDAKDVHLAHVLGRISGDDNERIKQFEAGGIDAFLGGGPPLRQNTGYKSYSDLDTEYYVFNTRNVPDVNERRSLALAIDRRSLVAGSDDVPASGLTPKGTPGFTVLNPASPWLPEHADLQRAKQLMAKVQNPKRDLRLVLNESGGPTKELAAARIARAWRELGIHVTIRSVEWAEYLSLGGPPMDGGVDVLTAGWFADFPDAYNFLAILGCGTTGNFCDRDYDNLLKRAPGADSDAMRYGIYAQLERRLFGPNGSMPVIPLWWTRVNSLARSTVKGFAVSGFGPETWTDLTKVSIATT
jgi:oligopeptide transport system substrate-binding protein